MPKTKPQVHSIRIVHVMDHLERNGPYAQFLQVAQRLAGGRYHSEAIVLHGSEGEQDGATGSLDVSYAAGRGWSPWLGRRLAKRFRFGNYDIVHVHGAESWRRCNRLREQFADAALILHLHDGDRYERLNDRLPSLVLAGSNRQLDALPRSVPRQHLYAGVDTERYTPFDAREREELRNELDLPSDAFLVGATCGNGSMHDLPALFGAIAALRGLLPGLRVMLSAEATWARPLLASADKHGLAECLMVVTGEEFLEVLDVYIALHNETTAGLQVAMACGLPCIASAESAASEIVTHEADGLLYASNEPVALIDTIRRFHDEPTLRQACGEAARARAEELFGLGTVAGKLSAIYEDLLAGDLDMEDAESYAE